MKSLLIITLVLALGTTSVILAQPEYPKMCQGGPGFRHFEKQGKQFEGMRKDHKKPGIRMILAVGDEINLTEDQRDRLEQMQVEFQMEKVDRKAEAEKADIRLKALMRDDDAPESEVMMAIDESGQLKTEMKKMHYRHFQTAKRVLNKKQIEKLKELRRERKRFKKEVEMEIERR